MKRPYLFSLDFPHAPAFNYNKLPTYAEISTNAKTSWESESGFQFDAGNSSSRLFQFDLLALFLLLQFLCMLTPIVFSCTTCREVPSCSASNSEPSSKKRNKGIKDFDGHFLTLATPNPIPCPSTSLAFHNQECPEFESPSCQVCANLLASHYSPLSFCYFHYALNLFVVALNWAKFAFGSQR